MMGYSALLNANGAINDGMVLRGDGVFVLSDPSAKGAAEVEFQAWLTAGNVLGAAIPFPKTEVFSQDLMAQFSADDAAKIQVAIAGNVSFWLLWQAMTAQKDPMVISNTRFKDGWAALIQVLGADRMATIATVLGVNI